jgi:hypothetical protein
MIAAKSNGHRHRRSARACGAPRFAVLVLSKPSANDLDMLRRFYNELAQLDELHQELMSNPEKDIK